MSANLHFKCKGLCILLYSECFSYLSLHNQKQSTVSLNTDWKTKAFASLALKMAFPSHLKLTHPPSLMYIVKPPSRTLPKSNALWCLPLLACAPCLEFLPSSRIQLNAFQALRPASSFAEVKLCFHTPHSTSHIPLRNCMLIEKLVKIRTLNGP